MPSNIYDPRPEMGDACYDANCDEPICVEYRRALAQWQSRQNPQAEPELGLKNNMNKYIAKMGIEIEGCWHEEPRNRVHDGSVKNPGGLPYCGESVSPPYAKFTQLTRYLQDNHPDRVDTSCGLHVHFSFTRLEYYSRLMDAGFKDHFYKFMAAWAKTAKPGEWFNNRLRGGNQYCLRDWYPDKQAPVSGKNSHRYAAWNFCYRLHGTAECRLLPCFSDVNTCIAGIRAVKASVLTWLRSQEKAGPVILEADEIVTAEMTANNRQRAADELVEAYESRNLVIDERV